MTVICDKKEQYTQLLHCVTDDSQVVLVVRDASLRKLKFEE